MEDDLNFFKNGRQLNFFKIEDAFNFFKNGRRPQLLLHSKPDPPTLGLSTAQVMDFLFIP